MIVAEDRRSIAFRLGLSIVGLLLIASAVSQILGSAADYGVPLWPPIEIFAGSIAIIAAALDRTTLMLFATGLITCLSLYARTAGDSRLLLAAGGVIAILIWARGRTAGLRLVWSVLGFTASIGSLAFGLFMLYLGLLTRGQAEWIGGGIVALALGLVGLWSASRDFRTSSRAAKRTDPIV